jgi:hypothetical protein
LTAAGKFAEYTSQQKTHRCRRNVPEFEERSRIHLLEISLCFRLFQLSACEIFRQFRLPVLGMDSRNPKCRAQTELGVEIENQSSPFSIGSITILLELCCSCEGIWLGPCSHRNLITGSTKYLNKYLRKNLVSATNELPLRTERSVRNEPGSCGATRAIERSESC